METPERKLGIDIANAVETHWFNPATVGGYLAEQPHYTSDRIMELVLWVIEKQAQRHKAEQNSTSEGLWLANELDKVIDTYKKNFVFDNLKLP